MFIGSQCLHLQEQGVQEEEQTVEPEDEDTTILGNTANYLYKDIPSQYNGHEHSATLLIARCIPALSRLFNSHLSTVTFTSRTNNKPSAIRSF